MTTLSSLSGRQFIATITCYSGSVNEALDSGELDDKFWEMVGDLREATRSGELFDRIAAIAQENGAGEFATDIGIISRHSPSYGIDLPLGHP